MDQDTQNSIPDASAPERRSTRAPWWKKSEADTAGAAVGSKPSAVVNSTSDDAGAGDAAHAEPLRAPRSGQAPRQNEDASEAQPNPIFGSGIRRVPPKSAEQSGARPTESGESEQAGRPTLGFKRPAAQPAERDPAVAAPLPSEPGGAKPRRALFGDAADGTPEARDSAPRVLPNLDNDADGLSTPRRKRADDEGLGASHIMSDAAATRANPEVEALRPPKPRGAKLTLPDAVKSAASLSPKEAVEDFKATKSSGKDGKLSLHRRLSKGGWALIVASQLVLATGAIVAIRSYFKVGQNASNTTPVAAAATTAPIAAGAAAAPTSVPQPTTASATATIAPEPTRAQPAADASAAIAGGAMPLADAPADQPNALFGPSFNPGDGKPTYVCAASPDASSLVLQQMQMSNLDITNGFHLGIVPLQFDTKAYNLTGADRARLLADKNWDCIITTVDEAARDASGVVTAITDENVGGYAIWSRTGVQSYEALRGRSLGFVADSPSQFFARYVLGIMPAETRDSVKRQSFESMDAALAAFNAGTVDAVALPDAYLRLRGVRGVRPVIDTAQLRVMVGAVVTSRAAIADRPQLVQQFHTAYFAALKQQLEDVDASASRIANWGHNAWTGVSREAAAADLRQAMSLSAQATAAQNAELAADAAPIVSVLNGARELHLAAWVDAGRQPPAALPPVEQLIDLKFAAAAAADPSVVTNAQPINAGFSLRASADVSAPAPSGASEAATVAVLPCRKFTFEPDSARLTDESRKVLDLCVAPALKQRVGLYLLVRGSAAWPGPKGAYNETQIREIANARAKAIADYLTSLEIDPSRFKVETVLPPLDRRDTDDPVKQSEDRWVEMSLITGGR